MMYLSNTIYLRWIYMFLYSPNSMCRKDRDTNNKSKTKHRENDFQKKCSKTRYCVYVVF